MSRRIVTIFLLLLTGGVWAQTPKQAPKDAPAAPVSEKDTRTLNLSAYAELLRTDIRAQKVAILTQLMEFSEGEDKAFWPIYREYDLEMAKLGDERTALIAEYRDNYGKMTDAIADKLATSALDLESRRRATLAKCYDRVKAAMPPRKALRFLQIEHQLQLLIDLQISSLLPITD